MKEKIIAKKTAEMKGYMGDVKGLLSLYVPPDPQKMERPLYCVAKSETWVPGPLRRSARLPGSVAGRSGLSRPLRRALVGSLYKP